MTVFNFTQNGGFYYFDYLEKVYSSISHYSNSPFKRIRAGKRDKHNAKFNNNMKIFSLPRDISRTQKYLKVKLFCPQKETFTENLSDNLSNLSVFIALMVSEMPTFHSIHKEVL